MRDRGVEDEGVSMRNRDLGREDEEGVRGMVRKGEETMKRVEG